MHKSLTVFFLLIVTCAVKGNSLQFQRDTIKVPVKITLKEKPVNFDSMYKSMNPPASVAPIGQPNQLGKKSIITEQSSISVSSLETSSEVETAIVETPSIKKSDTESSIVIKMGLKEFIDLQKTKTKENAPQSRINFVWIGFVLLLGGIVLGIIFGKYAFLISVFGTILLVAAVYLKL